MTRTVAPIAMAVALSGMFSSGPLLAGSAEKYSAEGEHLSANQYVTFEPLIIPMVEKGRHTNQYTLIVAVELAREDDRNRVRNLTPVLRNEMYETLFRLVTYRTAEPRIPQEFILRDRLFTVVRRIVGEKYVKSLVIRHAEVADVR